MSASVLGKRWAVRDEAPPPATKPDLLARLLTLRGITNRPDARRFLQPQLPERIDLPNLPAALDRLARAIRAGERIVVYGDYDADGITAAAVLTEGIRELGGAAAAYIPDRLDEGYGLHRKALSALASDGVGLVVAVDTGTSALDEVAHANERGLDVIVVDHHMPKAELPDAVALVNPHFEGTPDELRHLSGCGVAFAVLLALAEHMGRDLDAERYLDLVAIGTVCDVVPLIGANRAFVTAGLRVIDRRARPGIAALLDVAGVAREATTHTLGFQIGPRINAAGRLDHGFKAFELLTTRDPARARELAEELEALNGRRQQLTAQAVTLCRALALAECDGAPLVMVGHADISPGIVGLVAARLADEHVRPAIVFQRGEEYSTGSARSIEGFDIHLALSQGRDLLDRFGGHHQAGGFRVRTERVEDLRRLLTDWAAAQLDWSQVVPTLAIDLDLDPASDLVLPNVMSVVRQLEPCGTDNAAPVFAARDVLVRDAQATADGKHLRMRLSAGQMRRPWPAIAFGMAPYRPRPGDRIDVAFQVSEDRYGEAQVKVQDFALRT